MLEIAGGIILGVVGLWVLIWLGYGLFILLANLVQSFDHTYDRYRCNVCGHKEKTRKAIRSHCKSEHGFEPTYERMPDLAYRCNTCGRRKKSLRAIRFHRWIFANCKPDYEYFT